VTRLLEFRDTWLAGRWLGAHSQVTVSHSSIGFVFDSNFVHLL
jgi:hypothetical protein